MKHIARYVLYVCLLQTTALMSMDDINQEQMSATNTNTQPNPTTTQPLTVAIPESNPIANIQQNTPRPSPRDTARHIIRRNTPPTLKKYFDDTEYPAIADRPTSTATSLQQNNNASSADNNSK